MGSYWGLNPNSNPTYLRSTLSFEQVSLLDRTWYPVIFIYILTKLLHMYILVHIVAKNDGK